MSKKMRIIRDNFHTFSSRARESELVIVNSKFLRQFSGSRRQRDNSQYLNHLTSSHLDLMQNIIVSKDFFWQTIALNWTTPDPMTSPSQSYKRESKNLRKNVCLETEFDPFQLRKKNYKHSTLSKVCPSSQAHANNRRVNLTQIDFANYVSRLLCVGQLRSFL